MRQGQQHRRGRGRNNVNNHPGNRNKGQNPLTRSFESNGPDVKVRGTPALIAEKYMQLARDAQSSGDHVLAENYLQHAEHYNRIILAYREQQMQQSGEMLNGSSRHSHISRQEMADLDDQADHDGGGDDGGGDQPSMMRQPGGERQMDVQPSFDDPRPAHPQQRHEHHHRFRDRHPRQDRQDRPERHGGERFERNRDRPYRSEEQSGEPREMRMPREPREHREPREPREHREAREHREPRHQPHDIPREAAPPQVDAPVAGGDEGAAPVRSENAPRRRERFGLGADQPDFLRRPVRRPRRDPDAEFAPEAPAVPVQPSADDTPRD